MKVNKSIFRNYDIRGVYNKDLYNEDAYYIGKAYCKYIDPSDSKKVIVGYDNRISSLSLTKNLIKGITSSGYKVIDIGLVTTPMLCYAREYYKIDNAIMVTASHNSAEYNGFKLFDSTTSIAEDNLQSIYDLIIDNDFIDGEGEIESKSIYNEYINMLKENIKLGDKRLKVAIDCDNGTASFIAPRVLKEFNIDLIEINCISDPEFKRNTPDPFIEENLNDLKETVINNKSDIGFGFDGDCDRVGIVDENGKYIPIDLFMVFIWKNLYNKTDKKRTFFDVKCSSILNKELNKLGIEYKYIKTGHSHIKKEMSTNMYDFAGELSGHVCFKDKYYGYDDGLYAALRTIEILSSTDNTFSSYLSDVDKLITTPEIVVEVKDTNKDKIINAVIEYAIAKEYSILKIDGIRINFDDGFSLVRASGTGSKLTTRFEASTSELLEQRKKEILDIIEKENT